jgi:hypothetical protein
MEEESKQVEEDAVLEAFEAVIKTPKHGYRNSVFLSTAQDEYILKD